MRAGWSKPGRADNPLGRKQTLLQLNGEHGFVLALEFDEEMIVAGVLDIQLRLREYQATHRFEGRAGRTPESAQGLRPQGHQQIEARAQVGGGNRHCRPRGLVDSRRGITALSSTIEFWKLVPLKEIFETEFKLPTIVESKTRAKTVAERMLGAGNKLENLVYIDYGVGIGAGIVVDGHLLYGRGCAVGEFGHTHVTEDGPACKCGSTGCLEALVGTGAVLAKYPPSPRRGGTITGSFTGRRGSEKSHRMDGSEGRPGW